MADVIYKRGSSTNLNNVETQDGQILVTTDKAEMYVDLPGNIRKKITDVTKEDKNKIIDLLNYTIKDNASGEYKYVVINGVKDTNKIVGEFIIPNTIEGYPVRTLADNAFFKCKKLVRIYIPETCSNIGRSAFNRCYNLVEACFLGNSISLVDAYAFANCPSLRQLNLPEHYVGDSHPYIRECLLYFDQAGDTYVDRETNLVYKKQLTEFTVPSWVTNIENYAFKKSNLKVLKLPRGIAFFNAETQKESSQVLDQVNLNTLYYEGDEAEWLAIAYPETAAYPNDILGDWTCQQQYYNTKPATIQDVDDRNFFTHTETADKIEIKNHIQTLQLNKEFCLTNNNETIAFDGSSVTINGDTVNIQGLSEEQPEYATKLSIGREIKFSENDDSSPTRIHGVDIPWSKNEAANKQYVDTKQDKFAIKDHDGTLLLDELKLGQYKSNDAVLYGTVTGCSDNIPNADIIKELLFYEYSPEIHVHSFGFNPDGGFNLYAPDSNSINARQGDTIRLIGDMTDDGELMVIVNQSSTKNPVKITGVATPDNDNDATNKKYVDDAIALAQLSGEDVDVSNLQKKFADVETQESLTHLSVDNTLLLKGEHDITILANKQATLGTNETEIIVDKDNVIFQKEPGTSLQRLTWNGDTLSLTNITRRPGGLVNPGMDTETENYVLIEGVATPTKDMDAANKKYVDDAVANVEPPENVATKDYVDTGLSTKVNNEDLNWNALVNESWGGFTKTEEKSQIQAVRGLMPYIENNSPDFDNTPMSGAGTETDPILIHNSNQLKEIINIGGDNKHYKLVRDLDLYGKWWNDFIPHDRFEGVFDGDNHVITNMTTGEHEEQNLFTDRISLNDFEVYAHGNQNDHPTTIYVSKTKICDRVQTKNYQNVIDANNIYNITGQYMTSYPGYATRDEQGNISKYSSFGGSETYKLPNNCYFAIEIWDPIDISNIEVDLYIPFYSYIGLFPTVGHCIIKNLGLMNIQVQHCTALYAAGGIIGRTTSGRNVTVENCYIDGLVDTFYNFGAAVGGGQGPFIIRNCGCAVRFMNAELETQGYGMIADQFARNDSVIENCYSTSSMVGTAYYGTSINSYAAYGNGTSKQVKLNDITGLQALASLPGLEEAFIGTPDYPIPKSIAHRPLVEFELNFNSTITKWTNNKGIIMDVPSNVEYIDSYNGYKVKYIEIEIDKNYEDLTDNVISLNASVTSLLPLLSSGITVRSPRSAAGTIAIEPNSIYVVGGADQKTSFYEPSTETTYSAKYVVIIAGSNAEGGYTKGYAITSEGASLFSGFGNWVVNIATPEGKTMYIEYPKGASIVQIAK